MALSTNLIPLYRKNTLYFVLLLCPNILEKKIVWISSIFFLYFIIISPWEKAQTFICANDCFVPSWVETGPVFLEKNIWKWRQCIFAIFVIIVSFEKDLPLHLKKLESSSATDAFLQFWLKLTKCLLIYRQTTDGQMNNGQHAIRKAHSSFHLSWIKTKHACCFRTCSMWTYNYRFVWRVANIARIITKFKHLKKKSKANS